MYFNDEYNDSLTVFKQHLNADKTFYPLALHATDIVTSDYPVSRELYDKYSENLRKAVDAVFYKEEDSDLALRLKANATRFGAFKAYNATQDIRREGRENSLTDAEWTEKRYNSFQAAEYNTAVARSRTAKQFEEFMDKDRMEALPNLKWLPSTSAEVREEHRVFWNRIWAKTDPFWSKNQPGNLWNCKCDWHETDDPVTDGNPQTETAALGLDGNPAITGKIFSDEVSYVERLTPKSKEIVENYVKPVMEHCEEYIKYKNDPEYIDVDFDWKTGALKAWHKDHKTHPNDTKTYNINGEILYGDDLEKRFFERAFKNGHKVIFRKEDDNQTDLDMYLDDILMDLASIAENVRDYRSAIQHKNKQLSNYNRENNTNVDTICLYFHDPTYWSYNKLVEGIQYAARYSTIYVKTVYVMLNDDSEIQVFRFP